MAQRLGMNKSLSIYLEIFLLDETTSSNQGLMEKTREEEGQSIKQQ